MRVGEPGDRLRERWGRLSRRCRDTWVFVAVDRLPGIAPPNMTFVTGGSGFLGGRLLTLLAADGVRCRALARTDAAVAAVEARGAEAVRGNLDDVAAMAAAMEGCDVVYHCAALAKEWGKREEFLRANVTGTENLLRAAGVRRVVHVSTEAVMADGNPLIDVDESRPRPARPIGLYPETKGVAEDRALAVGRNVVVVRPRFIWGPGDTTLVPVLTEAVRKGRFAWVGGGRFLTSTCNLDNVVEGMRLAAERGRHGEIYFLTDGDPVEFRAFVTALLATEGVDPGARELPAWIAWIVATLAESWATMTGSAPALTRSALALSAHQMTVVDKKAREQLGYIGRVSREAGLAAMRTARAGPLS